VEKERKMFETSTKFSGKVYTDQLKLFKIAFWDVRRYNANNEGELGCC